MSIYNSQEYNDAWDDMSSSLQEQLLHDVAQLESAALTSTTTTTTIATTMTAMDQSLPLQDTRYNKKQKRLHDEQEQFFVYKDSSLTLSPISETDNRTSAIPIPHLLDRTNQQHLQHYDPLEKKRYTQTPVIPNQYKPANNDTEKNIDIIDDDDMWLEFDDMDIPALLVDIENRNKNITAIQNQVPDDNDKEETTIAAAPSLAQLDNALLKFGGFQTAGSRKDIRPNDNSLKAAHDKALAQLAEPITLSPTASSPISKPRTVMKSPTLSPPSPPETTTKRDRQHSPISSDTVSTFTSGFRTARGTKLNEPTLEAKRKAQQLLLTSPTRPSPPLSTEDTSSYSSIQPHILFDTTNITTEFSNTSAIKSKESIMDVKLETQQLPQTQPTSLTSSATGTLNKDPLQHLSTPTGSSNSTYQYEDVLQLYGGFSKASGKKTDSIISEAAKKQALALFTSDTSSTQLTQPSSSSQGRTSNTGSSQQDSDGGETTSNSTSLSNPTVNLPDTSSPSPIIDQHKDTIVGQASTLSLQQGRIISDCTSLSVSPSPPPATAIPKPVSAFKRRTHSGRPRSKPFKSPAVNLDLIKAGLEKRVSATTSIRTKGPSVFDMRPIGCRRPLSSLGQPRKYTKETLVSMNISVDIIGLTPCNARSYTFTNRWGVQDAEKELLAAGASSSMLPKGWIENHYGWIVWKLAKRLCMFPHHAKTDDDDPGQWWSPEYVMNQLLYRYEREINLGQRPVIRRIMEQDDVPGKQMVLMVADIVCISSSTSTSGSFGLNNNTSDSRKYRLQLTDGWYQISACVDPKMNNMISQGQVYIGQKISITGAQLAGDFTPKTPLEALSMAKTHSGASPQHDITSTTLIISSNSCLPCPWDSTLGYPRQRFRRHVIRRLDTNIYENGGLITMMEVVICKKYPMMYTETLKNGMTVKRTSKDEEDYRRTLDLQQHQQIWSSFSSSTSSNSDILKTQDRRVSGYFRLRICDASNRVPKEHLPATVATLLVANTTEIMHMDLMEGRRYRLFFVKPYQPRNKLLEGPSLITTQLTKWEPLSSPKQQPQTIKDSLYPLRSICLCADIKDLTMADVDMAVLVLHTQPPTTQQFVDGRKAWHSTLLVTDSSLVLCQITYRTFYRPVQDMNGQILGLTNVRFVLHDAKCDIMHIKSSDESEFWTNPTGTMGFMQHAMKELKRWTESEPNDLASIQQRVKDLTQ